MITYSKFLIIHLFFWSICTHIRHAIVEELASFGANVYTCSRNQMELDECLRQWKAKGYKVGGSMCDLQSRSQRLKFMDNVSSYFGGEINILVSSTMQSFSLIIFKKMKFTSSTNLTNLY